MEVEPEALALVREPGDYDRVVSDLRQVGTVTQLLPPRVVLVALGGRPVTVDGADIYPTGDLPAEALSSLAPAERAFVGAWQARLRGKTRAGDQLPWDAPGREPPG